MSVGTGSVHSSVKSSGQTMTGGVESSTLIFCRHVELLPHASVAIHVLAIVNSCGHAPGVTTSLKVTIASGSQLSVALANPVLSGEVDSVHSIVASAGQTIDGGVVSCTN